MTIKHLLKRTWLNLPGWRTNRKLIIFESDDWGSIRMPSKEVFDRCIKAGYPVDKIAYEKYDSLASEEDIELLFDLLTSFIDKGGNHPVITANCVVANPDFEKIRDCNYTQYHYELITETFKKYPRHSNCFNLWKTGGDLKIFFPQFHGREHLNVNLFMEALRYGDRDVHFGFDNQMPGCIQLGSSIEGNKYIEATNYNSLKDKYDKLSIILEGLDLFEKLFEYKSETIIPTNYIWSPDFDKAILNKGVMVFQGINKLFEPIPGGKSKKNYYYLGQRNDLGQIYLVRNALFEPSMFRLGIRDPVNQCLSDISIAFRMKKPAIISSHRLNYVGFIDKSNRDKTLKMLSVLLHEALRKWPELEFISSQQLGRIIISQNE